MPGELATLARTIRACRICVETPLGRPMPHEPRPVFVESRTARILIAGQAPGTRVHATGIAFNDRSGDRLRDWLGVDRETFYDPSCFTIAPMGFCFPGLDAAGSDLPPRRECAPAWRAPLLALMPQISLVLVIGQYAQRWHIPEARRWSVNRTVSSWRTVFDTPRTPKVLPLPHPSWRNSAWLRRNPWFEADVLPFLRAEIRERLRRSP